MKGITRNITLAAILGSTILTGCQKEKSVKKNEPLVKHVLSGPNEVRVNGSLVKLPTVLDYNMLNRALLDAALDLDYSVRINNVFETHYEDILIKNMMEDYDHPRAITKYVGTDIRLINRYFNTEEIRIRLDKDSKINSFLIFPSTSTTSPRVKDFLRYVYHNLPD